jgi:DNA-binding CsgD family transcriptional regulator/exonuclease VII small subunit
MLREEVVEHVGHAVGACRPSGPILWRWPVGIGVLFGAQRVCGAAPVGGYEVTGSSAGLAAGGLLEREAELASMDVVLDRAAAGLGSVVIVEGPAGIGKSELLAAVRAGAAPRGFAVLRARGSEFEQEIAFGLARQLFEPMLRVASPGKRRRLLDGVARVGARALGVEAGEASADQFAAVHGLFWLCANRADLSSLAMLVDDVQWADDPSLAWLGYLARRVSGLAIALVLAFRSGERGGHERSELAQLLGDRDTKRLRLRPLSEAAVGAIVRAQLDDAADEAFSTACCELTGGNPLFLHELLAGAREEGLAARSAGVSALRRIAPAAIGTSVLARLGRLGPEVVALARAVAVLGAGAEVVLTARLAELDPAVAELIADRLTAAEILARSRPLEFSHPLIGAAVREDIAPGALRLAHRRAAELLDCYVAGSLAQVAAHLLACGPAGDAWVVQRLRDAASEALDRGAPDIAASYLRRALAEPPIDAERATLLLLLGTAEWRAGQPDAIAHLEQALAAADDDLSTLVRATAVLAPAYMTIDQAERSVELVERTLSAVGKTNRSLALTLEASIAGIGLTNGRTAPAASRRAELLRARVHTLADPPVELLAVSAMHAVLSNRAAEAQALAERALACQPYPPPLELCNFLIIALRSAECYDATLRLCGDLLTAARQRGAVREMVAVSVSRASAWLDCGALADAEADARWALERAVGIRRLHAGSELANVLIERDALDEAEQELEQISGGLASSSVEGARVRIARGRLRVAQGSTEEGLRDLLDAGRGWQRAGFGLFSAARWREEAALAHAAAGNRAEARRLAGEQVELARAFGRPRTLGVSLRAAGMVHGGEAGLALLSEAVETLERSQSPLELARALLGHGSALRRAGHRVQARTQLERALDLAHRCGARRIANEARSELIAAGARPRRDAITGRDALTASELRVARLAAEGLTNREIAQALFITTATVKAHLNHIYRKLDVTRRDQLGASLAAVVEHRREDSSARATMIS